MKAKFNLNNDGTIASYVSVAGLQIIDGSGYQYEVQGNEPFNFEGVDSHLWKAKTIVDGVVTEWEEKIWDEVSITDVRYDWTSNLCIITLSNGEVLQVACFEEWGTADVIAAIKAFSKYTNTTIL